MSNFTAIDFETATPDRNSICQVGLVIVKECEIIDRISFLVQPPDNKYSQRCIDVHGITPDQTENAPRFDVVYEEIRKHIENQKCVAHNAQFEIGCLEKTLAYYRIPYPKIFWYCTRKIYNASLSDACMTSGIIILKQHEAVNDAEACALLMIKDIQR